MFKAISTVLLGALLAACGSNEKGLAALAAVDAGALLIDVRTPEEFAGGHLPDAINIPHGEIVAGLEALNTDKASSIVVYCRSGNRSGMAMSSLQDAGYSSVMNAGAYIALKPVWDARG